MFFVSSFWRRPQTRKTHCAAVLFLLIVFCAPATARLAEEVVQVPAAAKDVYGRQYQHVMTVTIFRDDERAKSPFLVISHGRSGSPEGRAKLGRARYPDNARYFVSQGFAVFVPTRIGYGITGGPDIEDYGSCARAEFAAAFEAGAVQVAAVIEFAKAQSFVDPTKGLLVGQSRGGAITLALAAKNVSGVVAAINFAGGAGGDPQQWPERPCSEPMLRRIFATYGETARIPTIWLYSENDRYWGKEKPRIWFELFRENGAAAEFVQLPSYRADGHVSFNGNPDAWKPAVEKFLADVGFGK
jgi:dienelactone hydrolase